MPGRIPSRLRGRARVLIATEPVLARFCALALNHGAYDVRLAHDVAGARAVLRSWRPHLFVVDVELAPEPGARLIEEVSAEGEGIPVVAVARHGDLRTRLEAFDHGADDVLTAPFSPDELVARLHAVARRAYGRPIPFVPVVRAQGLEIDLENHQVRREGVVLRLTRIEEALLYLLAANAGEILDRDAIIDALWGPDYAPTSNVVDRHIRNLRLKLENAHQRHYIDTVPRRGYRFRSEVDPAAA